MRGLQIVLWVCDALLIILAFTAVFMVVQSVDKMMSAYKLIGEVLGR